MRVGLLILALCAAAPAAAQPIAGGQIQRALTASPIPPSPTASGQCPRASGKTLQQARVRVAQINSELANDELGRNSEQQMSELHQLMAEKSCLEQFISNTMRSSADGNEQQSTVAATKGW